MSDAELQAQIEAAVAYEDLFVPALFRQWAGEVVGAAQIQPGERVLDVACGTGVLAREAASRVAPGGFVAGLDLNPGMLAVAARLASQIEWRQGTAEELPFPDESFDAVVSQFGLMFIHDRRQAIREMLRVLAPGGRLAVAVWGPLDSSPGYATEIALIERLAGERAAEALRGPFVLGDVDQLSALFAGAGMPSAVARTYPGAARFPSIRSMVEADLRGWLPLIGIALPDDLIDRILEEAEQALRAYVTSEGVAFDLPANIVTGTKP